MSIDQEINPTERTIIVGTSMYWKCDSCKKAIKEGPLATVKGEDGKKYHYHEECLPPYCRYSLRFNVRVSTKELA